MHLEANPFIKVRAKTATDEVNTSLNDKAEKKKKKKEKTQHLHVEWLGNGICLCSKVLT